MRVARQDAPLRIAIIGCGQFGRFVAHALRRCRDVRVVAACDPRSDILHDVKRQLSIPHVTTEDAAILRDPHVEAVHIATPPDSHAAIARAALRAGKHVVVEKPLALTVRDAQDLIRRAARRKRVLATSFVFRQSELFHTMRTLIQSRAFGPPRWIAIENITRRVEPPTHWFWDLKKSGGVHMEHGVHFFDTLSYLLEEEPAETEGFLLFRKHRNAEAAATLRFPGGTLAHVLHAFILRPETEHTRWLFAWDHAHAELEGWIPQRLTVHAEPRTQTTLRRCGLRVIEAGNNHLTAVAELRQKKESLYMESVCANWQDVARAIRRGTPVSASGTAGLRSLTTAMLASRRHINL